MNLRIRNLKNRINSTHRRALRTFFRGCKSASSDLLKQNRSVSINQRILEILAKAIFKIKNDLNLVIIENWFQTQKV